MDIKSKFYCRSRESRVGKFPETQGRGIVSFLKGLTYVMKKSQVFCVVSAIFSAFAFSNCASKEPLTYSPETGSVKGGAVQDGGDGVGYYEPVNSSYRGGGSYYGGGFGHGGFGHGGFGHGGFGGCN